MRNYFKTITLLSITAATWVAGDACIDLLNEPSSLLVMLGIMGFFTTTCVWVALVKRILRIHIKQGEPDSGNTNK